MHEEIDFDLTTTQMKQSFFTYQSGRNIKFEADMGKHVSLQNWEDSPLGGQFGSSVLEYIYPMP
jgi:hypothetical protein